jgi:hypothetical protein
MLHFGNVISGLFKVTALIIYEIGCWVMFVPSAYDNLCTPMLTMKLYLFPGRHQLLFEIQMWFIEMFGIKI